MDLLILGGGYGKRLFGEYNPKMYIPKGLIKIKCKHCIDYTLETFSNCLIDKIILETNNEGEKFYRGWSNESRFKENIEIFIDKLSTPNNVLGVLSTINLVNNYYNFKEPILIVAPDNIFTRNQDELITGFIKGARMAAYETDSLMNAKKYGVLELSSNKIISCCEKPTNPKSKIIRTSCEIWDQEVFLMISKWIDKNDPDKVGDFINFLINQNIRIESFIIKGEWIDMGSVEDLNKVRVMFG